MNLLFVDTSAWAAIADASDDQHQAAVAYQVKIAGRYRLVITNYILDELYTLLLMNVGYAQTINFKHRLDQLIEGGFIEVRHPQQSWWLDECDRPKGGCPCEGVSLRARTDRFGQPLLARGCSDVRFLAQSQPSKPHSLVPRNSHR